jgi:nucleoside-diphosphate-sugar epimerase
MRLFVTGANGFIGQVLCCKLREKGLFVKAALRKSNAQVECDEKTFIDALNAETDWSDALLGIDVIIHLASRVHVMEETVSNPLAEYRKVNVQGTLNLARQAYNAGIRRFIFISSLKVNGESTPLDKPFTSDDTPSPVGPYAISKCEAEDALRQLTAETGMEIVIIRPPLVYGPGVKANFLNMMCWLNAGFPLPLGAIKNKRSLVSLDNLIDLIVTCIDHPGAANQTFLVSDGEDISTTELLRRTAAALDKTARLLPMPMGLLRIFAALSGKSEIYQRLCGSLQVDIGKSTELLGWLPPFSQQEALQMTAKDFLDANRNKSGYTGH